MRPLKERLAGLFPWPFVGGTLLLIVLILLTPNLLTAGAPSAGSLETQAELIIDVTPGTPSGHVYLEGVGSTVRYASMTLNLFPNISWPPPHALASMRWPDPVVHTNTLDALATTNATSFAVNASAVYIDSAGVRVDYSGSYAFNGSTGMLQTVALRPGEGTFSPTPLSALPMVILLNVVPSTGSA